MSDFLRGVKNSFAKWLIVVAGFTLLWSPFYLVILLIVNTRWFFLALIVDIVAVLLAFLASRMQDYDFWDDLDRTPYYQSSEEEATS